MKIKKLISSIEAMPKGAYILLKFVLILCCLMLLASCFLFVAVGSRTPGDYEIYNLAVLLLESPAGLLFAGGIGVAILLDHS